MSHEVKVTAFVCTWSHFMNEEIGTLDDFQFSPEVTVKRMVCSGSLELEQVIKALIDGADGIFIGTCEPEKCRFTGELKYNTGSKQASAKIFSLKEALRTIGVDPRRLKAEWLSPKRPDRFEGFVEEFRAVLKGIGPLSRDEATMERLEVMKEVMAHFRVKWVFGKKLELTTHGNAFGDIVDGRRMNEVISDVLRKEYIRMYLVKVLERGPATVDDMAKATGFPTDEVLGNLMRLRQRGVVVFHGERDHRPMYSKEGAQ